MLYDGGLSVAKVLSKGAFFNENVMTFRIEDGKTTLDVGRSSGAGLIKVFMPEYLQGHAGGRGFPRSFAESAARSPSAHGDLKFKK